MPSTYNGSNTKSLTNASNFSKQNKYNYLSFASNDLTIEYTEPLAQKITNIVDVV